VVALVLDVLVYGGIWRDAVALVLDVLVYGGIWRDVVALVLAVLAYGGPALSVSVDDDAEA